MPTKVRAMTTPRGEKAPWIPQGTRNRPNQPFGAKRLDSVRPDPGSALNLFCAIGCEPNRLRTTQRPARAGPSLEVFVRQSNEIKRPVNSRDFQATAPVANGRAEANG